MKQKPVSTTAFAIVKTCVLLAGLNSAFAQESGMDPAKALQILAPLPDRMPGAGNDSAALVTLGKKLYFEKRLSQNGSQSCATLQLGLELSHEQEHDLVAFLKSLSGTDIKSDSTASTQSEPTIAKEHRLLAAGTVQPNSSSGSKIK